MNKQGVIVFGFLRQQKFALALYVIGPYAREAMCSESADLRLPTQPKSEMPQHVCPGQRGLGKVHPGHHLLTEFFDRLLFDTADLLGQM